VDQAVKHLISCEKKISGMTHSILSGCAGDVYEQAMAQADLIEMVESGDGEEAISV
jgi:hypothetical protein